MLDKGKTNYTVYASILNLFVSARRKAHDLIVETEYIGVLYIIVRVIFFFILLQVSPFGEWNKLKIYNCIVFTGFEPQNFIFLKVSAGGLVLTYSSARYSYKHLYKVCCYRKKSEILTRGQCQTLMSQIFSGAEAIDKNLSAFCLNVF